MGCHTWFYKALTVQPSYEECRDVMDTILQNEIDVLNKFFGGEELTERERETIEVYDRNYWDKKHCLDVYTRQLRMIRKGLCKTAVMDKWCFHQPGFLRDDAGEYAGPLRFIDGIFYTSKNADGKNINFDVFRVHDYPEDVLHSFSEFLEFWYNHNCSSHLPFNEVCAQMEKFWNEYPDGIVVFG